MPTQRAAMRSSLDYRVGRHGTVPPADGSILAALRSFQRSGDLDPLQTMSSGSFSSVHLKPCRRQGTKGKNGSRFYLGKQLTIGLWQKLALLNPLLLIDLALPIFHPASPVRRTWDAIMLFIVLYVAVVAPLKISFIQMAQVLALQIMDYVVTGSLSLDILANFRTAYISARGELVRDSRLIATRYVRGLFAVDVAAALPFSIILRAHGEVTTWLVLLKLIPLLRLIRLLRGHGSVGNMLSMARLVIFMLLVAHWCCCFWHYLSEVLPEWPWMFTVKSPTNGAGIHYLIGFYSAFLLLLGDRPDTHNNLERAVVTGMLFLGALLYAIMVGSMSLLIANIWAMASRHKQRAAQVDDALRYRGVSPEVREQVGEYFSYLAQYQHPGTDGVAYLQELPVGLYNTAMGVMFGPMLSKVQLFAHCEPAFTWRLAQRLRLSLYMPTDTIYGVGSVGHDMYVIWKGAVALVGQDGCMTALLTDGDHFGELGVMTASTPRPHRAVALHPSDVLLLSRWDLQIAMKDFPESAALVKYRAKTRLEDHEAPGNHLWAFVAGWDQVVAHQAAGAESGLYGSGDGDSGGSIAFQAPEVQRRRQQSLASAPHQQQPQQSVMPSTEIRFSDGGDGSHAGQLPISVSPSRSGPVAESLETEAACTATIGHSSTAAVSACGAAAVVAAQAASPPTTPPPPPPPSTGLRAVLSGLGMRFSGLLRSERSQQRPVEDFAAANEEAAELAVREGLESLSQLAASSSLSVRATSSATLQALTRQGQNLTATKRRSLLSPAPSAANCGTAATDAEAPTPTTAQSQDAAPSRASSLAPGSRAWAGSQDDGWPGGVRPTRSSQGTTITGGVAGAAGCGKLQQPQRSRQRNNLWLESVFVEEFTNDDGGYDEYDDTADVTEAAGARRLLKRRSAELPASLQEQSAGGTARQRLGPRQAGMGGGALPGRVSLQLQWSQPQSPAVSGAGRRAVGQQSSAPLGAPRSSAEHLPHLRSATSPHFLGALPPSQQQQQQEVPTLDEVWKQIQRAAAGASGSERIAAAAVTLQRTVSPFQDGQPRPPSMSSAVAAAASLQQVLGPRGRAAASPSKPYGLSSEYDGSDTVVLPGVRGPRTSLPLPPPLHGELSAGGAGASGVGRSSAEGASSGGASNGGASNGGLRPNRMSCSIELSAEGLEALAPAPVPVAAAGAASAHLTALLSLRPSLSPFAIFGPQGQLSPFRGTTKASSSSGYFPTSAAAGRQQQAAVGLPGSAYSPLPLVSLSSRALPRTTSHVRARCNAGFSNNNNNNGTRLPRISAEYTAISSVGGGGGRLTADGLIRGGGGESEGGGGDDDDDDGGWSSDSSREEGRRLVSALRAQLGQANARILLLESRLADSSRDPLQVPAVAAAVAESVQREVAAALARVGSAVEVRLSALSEKLVQVTERTNDLAKMIFAADERLKQLEDVRDGEVQEASGTATAAAAAAVAAASATAAVVSLGPASGMGLPNGGGGSSGSSSKLQGALGGLPGSGGGLFKMESVLVARSPAERRRSCSGLPGASLAPMSMTRALTLQMEERQEGGWEWCRSLTPSGMGSITGGTGAGISAGPASNGGRRSTANRLAGTTQAPLQGILKLGTFHHRTSNTGGVSEHEPQQNEPPQQQPQQHGLRAVSNSSSALIRPVGLDGVSAAAIAAAAAATWSIDKDVSVRRGRSSYINMQS